MVKLKVRTTKGQKEIEFPPKESVKHNSLESALIDLKSRKKAALFLYKANAYVLNISDIFSVGLLRQLDRQNKIVFHGYVFDEKPERKAKRKDKRTVKKKAIQKKSTFKKNPASRKKLKDAIDLFEDFTGMEANHYDVMIDPENGVDTFLKIGYVEGIAYNTVRDGKKEKYFHQFKPNARPILASSHDGKILKIIGKGFTFTETGINDKKG